MRDAVAQGVACAAGQFQRAAGKGFEFAHGGGLMMTVLANSLTVAALNRREREARVLNAGSFMHGSRARGPISCRSGFGRELLARGRHQKEARGDRKSTRLNSSQ